MRCTIPKKALVALLASVKGAAGEPKNPVHALCNVLLYAAPVALGGELNASATDLYRAARSSAQCDAVDSGGAIALPVRDLEDRVKAMPDGAVEISTLEGARAVIRSVAGKRRYEIAGLPAEEMPAMPAAPADVPTVSIGAKALGTLIARTDFSVSSDETRPHINSALFSWRDGSARMVSTDGHRLSVADVAVEVAGSGEVLIVLSALRELRRIAESTDAASIAIKLGDPWIHCEVGGLSFAFKRISSEQGFPPYEQVIPASAAGRAKVSRVDLIDAVRAVSVAAVDKQGSVRLGLDGGRLSIRAESAERGAGEDELSCSYEGPAYVGAFNAQYLAAPLAALDCDTVEIAVSGSMDPLAIRPIDGGQYTAVLMPVRM